MLRRDSFRSFRSFRFKTVYTIESIRYSVDCTLALPIANLEVSPSDRLISAKSFESLEIIEVIELKSSSFEWKEMDNASRIN